MATLPGLHLRGGIYQLRVVIPLDLRHQFGGQAKIVQSLRTADNRIAKLAGVTLRASLLADFAARRGESGTEPSPVANCTATSPRVASNLNAVAHDERRAVLAKDEQQSATPSLRDVFGKWKTADVRGPDAISACDRALKLFEESLAGAVLPASDITRAHGADFKGWLVTKINAGEMASKTAHDRLTSVKGLLRYACDELEVIPKHPWRGLLVKHKTENPRRPWTHEQIQAMAALTLFTAYELPRGKTGWRGGGAAAYWVPLLGLYTGATVSELCQLRTNDVELAADGSGLIHITEDDDSQQLKNFEHRRRVVPVHSELVRLGLLDYAKATPPGQLWPDLKFRKGKPGAYFSDWFGMLRKPAPGVELFPDFHSIRHTARSKLTAAGVPAQIQDLLTGHTVQGSAGSRVYTHVETPQLREAIETIAYQGLNLLRAYPI